MTTSKAIVASDFRLTLADADFFWAGERCANLPVLRWLDGTICEPVLMFFGWLARTKRKKISSMRLVAYDIRQFLAFLANRGSHWTEATDLSLAQWRESHRPAIERRKISKRQVERKLHNVFEFYRLLPRAMRFDESLRPHRVFVGPEKLLAESPFQITSKTMISPRSGEREIWSGSEHIANQGWRRTTPNPMEVEKVLTHLRSRADVISTRRNHLSAGRMHALQAEARWLMARCMAEGGCRALEVADLSIAALLESLRREGILGGRQYEPDALDELGTNSAERSRILAAIDAFEARGRKRFYVRIDGKGGKVRDAPFPAALMRDLLNIGIWTVRIEQVSLLRDRVSSTRPTQLFLSSKTKGPFEPGSIGDMMKRAFNALSIGGSGHRLRAFFATMYANDLLEETLMAHGYRFSQAVENTVLDRLAEALGHSRVTTTIRYYVDMALMKHFRLSNRDQLNAVRKLYMTIGESRQDLTLTQVKLIKNVVSALAAAESGSLLEELLAQALDDPELNPARRAAPANEEKSGPKLKLVK
ncbi:hypothetical protein GCM10011611_03230 [Aliidongia dinghuensis]|uniref:Tyr recombinase domain-containing protein n=1 Tax=Aliidongia dinghuensis TaxID=1867774 RepID=A0A8J2YNT5_9PROT|nr:site-specific integrase [Aliidongia dinghuensis]GGF01004.1 hypothetical protein GCM10011611_03230 [Aliidongia dinghuensis]